MHSYSNNTVAIGFTATANTSDCVAIGYNATCANVSGVVIDATTTTATVTNIETLPVGTSVKFDYRGRNYTGEITGSTDGVYLVRTDLPLPGWTGGQGDLVFQYWQVQKIDPLQRFTEAVHG